MKEKLEKQMLDLEKKLFQLTPGTFEYGDVLMELRGVRYEWNCYK
jgi:hypothetical protein